MAIPNSIAGTFAATGNSSELVLPNRGFLTLDFAGTATVELQVEDPSGNWINAESYTADTAAVIDGCGQNYRLNCSAHTNNVVYALKRVRSSSQGS